MLTEAGETTQLRVIALGHAMHLADIVATHNDKEVSPQFVVDAADVYLNFLTGVPKT